MSEELGAVLEAPEVIADEVVNQDQTEVEGIELQEKPAVEEVKGDERVMPQWLRTLKTTDPATFRTEKAKFFTERAILEAAKDFDVKGTRSWLEEKGGREAIESTFTELQGKAAELDQISEKIANGDPSLVNDLSPETLTRLAPVFLDKYAQADPEGWGAAMSGVMAATIQSNGIPLFLERMEMMLKYNETDQLKQSLEMLKGWAGSFQTKAQAPKTNTNQPDKKLTDREQQLNQRESQAFENDMRRDVDSFRSPLIAKELDGFFKRRPNDSEAKDLATATVRAQVIDRMSNDAGFQKSLNALMARKDKDGALRLIKSRETAAITEIAPKVGRTIFGNPGAAQTAKPGEKAVAQPQAGFLAVDKPPRPDLIDRGKTTDAMIMRGQFILKDGKKVSLEA